MSRNCYCRGRGRNADIKTVVEVMSTLEYEQLYIVQGLSIYVNDCTYFQRLSST